MIDKFTDVFKFAWSHTFAKELTKWWLGTSISGIISLLAVGKSLFNLEPRDSVFLGLLLIPAFFFVAFLYFICRFGIRYVILKYKERVYGNIMIELIAITAKINYARRQGDLDEVNFKAVLLDVCEELKKIFERKSRQAVCSVSFKALKLSPSGELGPQSEVFCLCRDSEGEARRHTPKYMSTPHSISNNSCYNIILNNLLSNKKSVRRYYINNNVPTTTQSDDRGVAYMNSSYDVYPELPYRSELVVPILPFKVNNKPDPKLSGFLCVDSNKPNYFEDRYDLAILQGVSDNIYELLVAFYPKNPGHGN